ncbi:MAG TPA: helix-turn-helix transcriptional regulator, partial [Streptomyces sp.]|nr:helix-turn-helix transcriptional regulator [Streptomyces sp.]
MGTSEEQLVREMRRLKERAGLSYEKLAARTNYSRSSWERFLNGKKPVTRLVVEQLASALDDGRPDELLALWARTLPGRDGEADQAGPCVTGRAPAAPQRGRLVMLG